MNKLKMQIAKKKKKTGDQKRGSISSNKVAPATS